MSENVISIYINEFHEDPKGISEYKIMVLKDFYFENINSIFPIKRNNFQIGVNKNKNLLFFRDKTNKHHELILNIIYNTSEINTSEINFRKQISYSFDSLKLDKIEDQNSNNILIQKSIDNLNSKIINTQGKKIWCKKIKCCIIN